MAGGPGDRWLGHREMAGREESPDTVLRHVDRFARVFIGEREVIGGTLDRATRLVTPGGAMGERRLKPVPLAALRKVPQRIDRRRSEARWHRTGKPVRRLRNARDVWQG